MDHSSDVCNDSPLREALSASLKGMNELGEQLKTVLGVPALNADGDNAGLHENKKNSEIGKEGSNETRPGTDESSTNENTAIHKSDTKKMKSRTLSLSPRRSRLMRSISPRKSSPRRNKGKTKAPLKEDLEFDSELISIVKSHSGSDVIYDPNSIARPISPILALSEVTDIDKINHQFSHNQNVKNKVSKAQLTRNASTSALEEIINASTKPSFKSMISDASMLDCDQDFTSSHKHEHAHECKSTGSRSVHELEIDEESGSSIATGASVNGCSVGESSHSGSNVSNSSEIYKLTVTNTGKSYDLRELERDGSTETCFHVGITEEPVSLFPTEGDLMIKIGEKGEDGENALGESTRKLSPAKALAMSLKRATSIGRRQDVGNDNADKHEDNNVDDQGGKDVHKQEKLEEFISDPKHISPTKLLSTGKQQQKQQQIPTDTSPKSAKKSRRRKEKRLKPQPLPEPKNTVKCNKKAKKQDSDFNPLLLISTISKAHKGPIWCSAFSKDGKYLATGGKDGVVQIWDVAPSKEAMMEDSTILEKIGGIWKGLVGAEGRDDEERPTPHPHGSNHEGGDALGTEIVMINPKPAQTFTDHDKDVVDFSWSHTGFLISGSVDKTVRLWHPSRPVCLRVFSHTDVVTSVSFNPLNDKFFVSGGFDKKLRIWNAPNGRVAQWAQVPNLITAATFHPDGNSAAAGLIDGKVFFYSVDVKADDKVTMIYHTQISTKQKGKKKGSKVSGLEFLQNLSADKVTDQTSPIGSPKKVKGKGRMKAAASLARNFISPLKKKKVRQQLLISTNDSRLRLVGMDDFCMVRKYKGHSNTSLQIRARFSESGEFIISGSEARGSCAIWNTATKRNPLNVNVTGINMYDKVKAHEWFEVTTADPAIVTDANFCPGKSVREAIISSGLFPTLHSVRHVNHDFSSSVIVACDYEGTIRIYLRRACIDAVSHVAGPGGYVSS